MLPSYAYFGIGLASAVAASPKTMEERVGPEGTRDIGNLIITAENTLNGTLPSDNPKIQDHFLNLSIHNYYNSNKMNVYITGLDVNDYVVMLNSSGEFYYPDPHGSTIPVPIPKEVGVDIPIPYRPDPTTNLTIPDYITSGRVYIADGELEFFVLVNDLGNVSLVQPSVANPADPSANVSWGFTELTNIAAGITADLSFVDFVGIPFGMRLTLGDGEVQTVRGLGADCLGTICDELTEQASIDGQPWDKMCVFREDDGKLLRVLSPNSYVASYPNAMIDYYTQYVDDVYEKYSTEDLIVDTQGFGLVPCRVEGGDQFVCEGDDRPFPKPTTADIWGCNSGPFAHVGDALHLAIVARMCAAFYRTELLLPGGNVTPSLCTSSYYTVEPTSYYSKFVHECELDGRGYAFSYDDVGPTGCENPAGLVAGPDPQLLEIFIAGGIHPGSNTA
ncbi:hypothetical protein SLS62_008837 [Diatrype stigma]|uniref:GH64 domain-containing protein n=1 Tax=Diatrype stigma TaxID=117547 RepID=A0AAN9YKR6_9PEZI